MTREQAIEELRKLQAESQDDAESAHAAADDLLCNLLNELGYEDVTTEFARVKKWYS